MAKGSAQTKKAATKKPVSRGDFIDQKWRGTGPPPLKKK